MFAYNNGRHNKYTSGNRNIKSHQSLIMVGEYINNFWETFSFVLGEARVR